MGKIYKILLALLYALQIVVVFRESLHKLYEFAAAPEHAPTDSAQSADSLIVYLKRTFVPYVFSGQALEPRRRETEAELAPREYHKDDYEHHHDHREEKDRARKLIKKTVREYFIANLYPFFKKITAAKIRTENETKNNCWRLMMFSQTA